jgi:hypothetical protein
MIASLGFGTLVNSMIFRLPADGAEVGWFSLRLFMRWLLSSKFLEISEKNDFPGNFFLWLGSEDVTI